MEFTKNQKIVGISLAGVIAWMLYRKKIKLQSHRTETPAGPTQVVVPVATGSGTGPIANILGDIFPSAHSDLVAKALNATPLVIQGGKIAPTRISTIADVQHALNFLKVCPQPLSDTGRLDPQTVACLKAFQSVMQIPITGMDDPTTKMTLESAVTKAAISTSAPAITSAPEVANPPTVNPTIQTERDLQRALNLLGASPKLKEDGKIGPVTTAAIKAFQVVHGLTADGLAGPQTKAAVATAVQGANSGVAALAPAATAAANAGLAAANQMLANGDFGYIPPPMTHPAMPGFLGAGGGPVPFPRYDRPWDHRGFVIPAPPPGVDLHYMQSWERWQQVHPGSSRADYDGWYAQNAASGATINGEFGFARAGLRGGGFRPMMRGRAFALGLPYDDEEIVETVETDDGNPMNLIQGAIHGDAIRDLEDRAIHEARHAATEAIARGDRRFEHPMVGPGSPPLPGEHRLDGGRVGFPGGERRGWFDRFRGWFGFGRRPESIESNPYIPPPANPPVMNWDPFDVNIAPAVDRWHPDDLRRREELKRNGYRPAPPVGIPAPPVGITPPAPPPPRR